MLVKTFIVSKFFFFDACEHVVEIVISSELHQVRARRRILISLLAFLIITELPLFKSYFARNWPLFSHRSGFVMLGAAMLLLGNSILGNLNKQATSQKSLGMAFWRIVIAAGIVVLVMGVINLFAVSDESWTPRMNLAHPTAELHLPRHKDRSHSPTSSLTWSSCRAEGGRGGQVWSQIIPPTPRLAAIILLSVHDLKIRHYRQPTCEGQHLVTNQQ